MTRHVVMFSGGIGSWAAAKRVAERHGTANLTLLFTDTKAEDEDLYRFLEEAAANVGGELVVLTEGRTPWEVMFDERMLGNSKFDPCSKILKRQMADRWLRDNCDPAETICYVGIDWSESHRFYGGRGKPGLQARRAADGWRYEAPMCEPPYLTKADMLRWLDDEGIDRPRLYDWGFSHNNCGGFCIKMGNGSAARLWAFLPDYYLFNEGKEQGLLALLGRSDLGILTDRTGGERRPMTLLEYRERLEAASAQDRQMYMNIGGGGGCGCFVDDEA